MNIYLIDVEKGTSRPLLPDGILGNIDPSWSPDGRYLAFVSNRSGAPEVWVAAVDGSGLQQLTNAAQYVRFPFWRRP
jgi:TolB protein